MSDKRPFSASQLRKMKDEDIEDYISEYELYLKVYKGVTYTAVIILAGFTAISITRAILDMF